MPKIIPLRALSKEEASELEKLSRARKAEKRLVERATMIWLRAQGLSTGQIARQLGREQDTVTQWVKRFNESGLAGLQDQSGRGRKSEYTELQRGEMIASAKTHPTQLGLPFHYWSLRRLVRYLNAEKQLGISRAQLGRILEAEGLRWYQEQTYFTERPDPQFAAKRGRL